MNQEILFQEKQQFRQWWLWLILVFVAMDAIYVTAVQWKSGAPFTFESMVLPGLVLLIPLGLFMFMYIMRLDTEIRADGVYVRFSPIHKKFRFYSWSEMEQVYVRKYSPLSEYGGWGLRGLGNNKALNISGNQGLQLVMKGGFKLLIGTQQPEEIAKALSAAGAPIGIVQP